MRYTRLHILVIIIMAALGLALCENLWADTLGPLTPTGVTSNDFGGTDPWVSPGSSIGSDDVRATSTTTAANKNTHFLIYTFSPSIPAGSTLTGIEVFVEAQSGGAAGSPVAFVPATNNGSVFNSLPAVSTKSIPPGPSDTVVTFGGTSDTWGGLTTADLNGPLFRVGCFMTDNSQTSTDTYSLDAVTMTVHFLPAGAPASSPFGIWLTVLALISAGAFGVHRVRTVGRHKLHD